MKKGVKNWADSARYDLETATHNLKFLVKMSGFEPPENIFNFMSKLSDVSIPTLYPSDFGELVKSYNREAAKDYLASTKEAFEWIKKSLAP